MISEPDTPLFTLKVLKYYRLN
ncbi:hypothetical protein FOXB_16136, partial [Fusarium oxysporum f. sp. conglutinans Fo5176]